MDIETFAINIFEKEFGYRVKKIRQSDEKTPDFFVEGYGECFLIELKSKLDDESTVQNLQKVLEQGEIAEFSDSIERKNNISKRINYASKQLTSIYKNVDYRMIWLMATDGNQQMKKAQFKASLYGNVVIADLDLSQTCPCYYFGFNDFYRTRNVIDAALISTLEEGELCLNTYSPKYHKIKKSALVQKFGNACCDPFIEEKTNKAMLVDTDIDRRDERAILKYLKKKYERKKLQVMQRHYYSSVISLSPNKQGKHE